MRRFLLVDDEPSILHALQRALRRGPNGDQIEFELFTSPVEAIKRCGEVPFDLVISDYRMPDMLGVDFLRIFKELQPNATRLLLSASTEFTTIMNAVNQAEVFRYLVKPWQIAELEEDIRLALEHRDKLVEDQRLADTLRHSMEALSPEERAIKELEEDEPGITKVNWGPDGSVILN